MAEKARGIRFSNKSAIRLQHLPRRGHNYNDEEIINGIVATKEENGLTKLEKSHISPALRRERRFTNDDLMFLQRLDPHERAALLDAEETEQPPEVSREWSRRMAESQLSGRKIRPPVHSRLGLVFQKKPPISFEEAAAQDAAELAAAQAAAEAEQARLNAIRVKVAQAVAEAEAKKAEAAAAAAQAAAQEEERKRLERQKERKQFEEDEVLYEWFAKLKGKQPASIQRSAKQLDYIKKLKAKEETKGGKRSTRKLK